MHRVAPMAAKRSLEDDNYDEDESQIVDNAGTSARNASYQQGEFLTLCFHWFLLFAVALACYRRRPSSWLNTSPLTLFPHSGTDAAPNEFLVGRAFYE